MVSSMGTDPQEYVICGSQCTANRPRHNFPHKHGSILMLFSVLLACLGGCPSPGAVYDFCCFYKPVVATHTIGQAEATEVQQILKFGPH